ncbi:type II toxin-antitoxin system YafQ family toxin [Campylobacter sp.]|uniref:type II toxin-antitoxin system RelE/ParE family toxin n=1 Tax=Campylobacter sp. TaxID=205 RepID=UPI002AA7457A|nr:type II toxin-antitoxin system YafQ family toxin [Campylobacter sp.]
MNKVITELQISEILRPELKDHALISGFKGFRECHIYTDLVVIYKRDDKTLTLYRIGRHQDLFKKY